MTLEPGIVKGDEEVWALIPARLGSQGLLRKNLRILAGKPLIAWTIEAALGATTISRVVVSTNDADVASVCASFPCEVIDRPHGLSQPESTAPEVIDHFLESSRAQGMLVYLQPTSPLRTSMDIDSAVEQLRRSHAEAVVSVRRAAEPPEWMYRLSTDNLMEPVLPHVDVPRRQDLPEAFLLNGAIYAMRIDSYVQVRSFSALRKMGYVMPSERSIDIDDAHDLEHAEKLLSVRKDHL